jgi:arylsulfatase A-like enzyme
VQGQWKYIAPSRASRYNAWVDIELGHDTIPQLYNLRDDPAERFNVAHDNKHVLEQLSGRLEEIRSTPVTRNISVN